MVDTVADGLFDELDYDLEALNADRFRESLDFLGFVDVPTFLPELSTNRVLTTEWIRGAHLEALSVKDGALMTQLAVEACTASLVLTGYVHADPHEGNLMLREDGKVVFLDFGLMSGVDGYIMESFAQGIRACLAEDYAEANYGTCCAQGGYKQPGHQEVCKKVGPKVKGKKEL